MIAPNLTATDPDSTNLTGATVEITANCGAGDTLGFTNQNGITGSFVGCAMALSGSSTLQQYT